MKVRATKTGIYQDVMRTPESKPFDYEAGDKEKTAEVVKKSSWLEPVEEQKSPQDAPAAPPDKVQQSASTQTVAPEQQPKAPVKAPAKKQAAKTAAE
ncbi:MAG: hypothetical protein N0E44_18930 [Candidatus Thiodiazotropha lotti]|nr:hypothetical protein [Candidatus Thiodiazotropha lotti]MCW4221960.1 hypothetical protein [Candidatus Thiodiazotropha lotti]